MARPTEGVCNVPMVFQVNGGRYGDVPLDATRAAFSIHTPGPMGEGNWTFALYVDQRATPEQRTALEQVFSGVSGGPIGDLFGPLIARRLPTRSVPIEFGKDGRRCWSRIPGVLDVEIEGILGADGGASWVDNLRHFVSRRLYTYRAVRSLYKDHHWTWDHAGRNAYYATFEWRGP